MSDWGHFAGGIERAASNPKYCYEWSFVEPQRLVVLNLWFEQVRAEHGTLLQKISAREWGSAEKNDGRHGVWKTRAAKFDGAVRTAYREKLPVRVIICDGTPRDRSDIGSDTSRVSKRLLDTMTWHVTTYNDSTGACTITRGGKPPEIGDQFSFDNTIGSFNPLRKQGTTTFYERDFEITRRVRKRSGGRCEYCGKLGFETKNGGIYLETHHVVPLSEGGPDVEANVIALCPDHHRQAHHARDALQLRHAFLKYLSSMQGSQKVR